MTAVLVIAAAVSTAACDSSVETSAPGASNTSASSQLGVRLRPLITQAMHELAVPGAVVLVRTPAGKYEEAFGTRQIGKKDPIKIGDHFRIGSISKTMLGTIVLQLVQEGRIALSDPISKYRFDVPNGDHITLEQLLNMRSGLYNYTELESFNRTVDTDPTKVWHPEEVLALALAQ
ncbi:MAG TPA: serine hydrolase domain-containing protein, partial [Gaiellales bacterium]|nr:serine hydrolase domain-containing protein [Gaiellales bacterium]